MVDGNLFPAMNQFPRRRLLSDNKVFQTTVIWTEFKVDLFQALKILSKISVQMIQTAMTVYLDPNKTSVSPSHQLPPDLGQWRTHQHKLPRRQTWSTVHTNKSLEETSNCGNSLGLNINILKLQSAYLFIIIIQLMPRSILRVCDSACVPTMQNRPQSFSNCMAIFVSFLTNWMTNKHSN